MTLSKLTLISILSLLPLTLAQDQCNLLPLRSNIEFPLKTYIPHTNTTTNTTICDKYAPKNMTQYQWIIQIINLAFTGDFPPPANGTYQSQGILNPNAYYIDPCEVRTSINLVPYFNGTYRSNNRANSAGEHVGTAINFLDGGSIPALRSNIPAWSTSSNQYGMMVGFYNFFSSILGCSDASIPTYTGPPTQTHIHRFMDLPAVSIHYFIHSIVDAATTIGGMPGADTVTHLGDSISIGIALDNVFNKRCSPAKQVVPNSVAMPQDMCADNATCATWQYGGNCTFYDTLSGFGVMPTLTGPGGANYTCVPAGANYTCVPPNL
ncbi:MAG: hypothetical protein OHK93_004632 [Ramalina farinacea]|uniref:Uncharacterized protein n=1 Tax=Ramalina farinacea TaxID=258253 RepID=A0AA43QW88_9LECA|nr:hypothetical protein [Ramalina farinacea]